MTDFLGPWPGPCNVFCLDSHMKCLKSGMH